MEEIFIDVLETNYIYPPHKERNGTGIYMDFSWLDRELYMDLYEYENRRFERNTYRPH